MSMAMQMLRAYWQGEAVVILVDHCEGQSYGGPHHDVVVDRRYRLQVATPLVVYLDGAHAVRNATVVNTWARLLLFCEGCPDIRMQQFGWSFEAVQIANRRSLEGDLKPDGWGAGSVCEGTLSSC